METKRDRLWGIEDVAAYLGVPVGSIYKMTRKRARNPIPHLKIGGRLRFRRGEIERWLDLWSVSPIETLEKAASAARR